MEDSTLFEYLCRLIEQVDLTLSQQRLVAIEQGISPEFKNIIPTLSQPVKNWVGNNPENNRTIGDVLKLFLESKTNNVGTSRMSQYKIPERVLREHLTSNRLLHKVDRDTCREIVNFLPKIPSHVTQRYSALSLQQAADKYHSEHGQFSGRHAEANKHCKLSKVCLIWQLTKDGLQPTHGKDLQ